MTRRHAMLAAMMAVCGCSVPCVAHTVSLAAHQCRTGEQVAVPVCVDTITNIASAHIQINFDPDMVTPVVVSTNGCQGAEFRVAHTNSEGTLDVLLVRDEPLVSVQSGVFVRVSFALRPGVQPGQHSALVVARSDLGGNYGSDLAAAGEVTHSNGSIWSVMSTADTDGDGLSDYAEQMINGSPDYVPGRGDADHIDADTDNDGMPDGWEYVHGLSPVVDDAGQDHDGDGYSNIQEYQAGTDPDDKASNAFAGPVWWRTYGVVNTNLGGNDYACANVGQLKWFASRAYVAVSNALGTAGDVASNGYPSAAATVAAFTNAHNFRAVTMGQVKAVAAPFYHWLINRGVTNSYPWSATVSDDRNDAPANVGQVKNVFRFELP